MLKKLLIELMLKKKVGKVFLIFKMRSTKLELELLPPLPPYLPMLLKSLLHYSTPPREGYLWIQTLSDALCEIDSMVKNSN